MTKFFVFLLLGTKIQNRNHSVNNDKCMAFLSKAHIFTFLRDSSDNVKATVLCPHTIRKKVTETGNFAKQSCQIYLKGDKNTFRVSSAVQGKAELCLYNLKSPTLPLSWSQVCVSTPEMYPRSGYFIVRKYILCTL